MLLESSEKVELYFLCSGAGGHARKLPMPDVFIDNLPFEYVLFNWNTFGHAPSDVYDTPHFDFHFFIEDFDLTTIRPGKIAFYMDAQSICSLTYVLFGLRSMWVDY